MGTDVGGGPEQRRAPRYPARVAVTLRFPSTGIYDLGFEIAVAGQQPVSGHDIDSCESLNLSRGGVMLELPYELPVGQPLSVALQLPSGRDLPLEAEVRHVEPVEVTGAWAGLEVSPHKRYQTGLRFLNVGPGEAALLEGLAHGRAG